MTEFLNRDLNKVVSMWCDMWGMELNVGKRKTMIVSRSRTIHPKSTPSTLDGTVLKESADLVIFGLTFDAKMTFEKHLRCFQCCSSEAWYHEKVLASNS